MKVFKQHVSCAAWSTIICHQRSLKHVSGCNNAHPLLFNYTNAPRILSFSLASPLISCKAQQGSNPVKNTNKSLFLEQLAADRQFVFAMPISQWGDSAGQAVSFCFWDSGGHIFSNLCWQTNVEKTAKKSRMQMWWNQFYAKMACHKHSSSPPIAVTTHHNHLIFWRLLFTFCFIW